MKMSYKKIYIILLISLNVSAEEVILTFETCKADSIEIINTFPFRAYVIHDEKIGNTGTHEGCWNSKKTWFGEGIDSDCIFHCTDPRRLETVLNEINIEIPLVKEESYYLDKLTPEEKQFLDIH
jgi:hypothetical protein